MNITVSEIPFKNLVNISWISDYFLTNAIARISTSFCLLDVEIWSFFISLVKEFNQITIESIKKGPKKDQFRLYFLFYNWYFIFILSPISEFNLTWKLSGSFFMNQVTFG